MHILKCDTLVIINRGMFGFSFLNFIYKNIIKENNIKYKYDKLFNT